MWAVWETRPPSSFLGDVRDVGARLWRERLDLPRPITVRARPSSCSGRRASQSLDFRAGRMEKLMTAMKKTKTTVKRAGAKMKTAAKKGERRARTAAKSTSSKIGSAMRTAERKVQTTAKKVGARVKGAAKKIERAGERALKRAA